MRRILDGLRVQCSACAKAPVVQPAMRDHPRNLLEPFMVGPCKGGASRFGPEEAVSRPIDMTRDEPERSSRCNLQLFSKSCERTSVQQQSSRIDSCKSDLSVNIQPCVDRKLQKCARILSLALRAIRSRPSQGNQALRDTRSTCSVAQHATPPTILARSWIERQTSWDRRRKPNGEVR